LIITALITKSAQVPFRAWLPAAIAAPTPVSALVHSSTLVTAGLYMQIRFESSIPARVIKLLFIVGILTIILARLRALTENDIKKIVALSTLSQLGIIEVGVGLGMPKLAFFHLLGHAYFKALLFVGAGNMIS